MSIKEIIAEWRKDIKACQEMKSEMILIPCVTLEYLFREIEKQTARADKLLHEKERRSGITSDRF